MTSIVNLVENTITKNDCKVDVEVDQDEDDNNEDDGGDDSTDGGGSIDPNDKGGSLGVTTAHWVLRNQPLNYTVEFENEPTATLPAQQVVITDKLNPKKVDLRTVALGPMGFNTTIVTPPSGVNNYSTTVDLRPAQDLLVQIQGSLDTTKGVLTWTFRSLDPATGLPPADPSAGFLPPDTSPPAGDGSVAFSVMPRARIVNGTKVANQGTVVFDTNAPISTPIWHNTIASPVPQALSITPTSLVFRHVPIFGISGTTSAPQAVTLTNPGPNPMVVESLTASAGFLLRGTGRCLTVLAPGQSCIFNVRFLPTDVGTNLGQVRINDNAPHFLQTVALKGIGVGGVLTPSPTALAFGKVHVNTTSATKLLTLTNATGATAQVVSLVPSANFVTSSDQCTGATLAPKASCTVDIAFSPTSAVKVSGALTVATDSVKTSEVPLSGTGIP